MVEEIDGIGIAAVAAGRSESRDSVVGIVAGCWRFRRRRSLVRRSSSHFLVGFGANGHPVLRQEFVQIHVLHLNKSMRQFNFVVEIVGFYLPLSIVIRSRKVYEKKKTKKNVKELKMMKKKKMENSVNVKESRKVTNFTLGSNWIIVIKRNPSAKKKFFDTTMIFTREFSALPSDRHSPRAKVPGRPPALPNSSTHRRFLPSSGFPVYHHQRCCFHSNDLKNQFKKKRY